MCISLCYWIGIIWKGIKCFLLEIYLIELLEKKIDFLVIGMVSIDEVPFFILK